MARGFNEILKDIGWTDGLHLPVANYENKKLQNEVEKMMCRKADLIAQLDSANENLNSLNKHIDDVKNETDLNQEISVAHHSQLNTEYSLLKDSEFKLSKTQQEIRTMDKEINHLQEKNRIYQIDIEHGTKKLDLLKETLQWGEEARLAWEEDLARGERNTNLLAMYKLEDDAKFKELELKRQRLKADVKERENILSKEVSEISNMENQLEQISSLFRNVHGERASLLHHWDEAVTILKQRDANIHSIILDIDKIRKEGREMYSILSEHRKFYETQVSNNEEIKKQVEEMNFKAIHLRQANVDIYHATDRIRSELTILRGKLSDLGIILNTQRSRNKQISVEVKTKTEEYNFNVRKIDEMKQTFENLNNEAMSAAQHAKELEKIMQATEENKTAMMLKLGKLRSQVFDKKQELQKLKEISSIQEQEMQNCVSNKQAFFRRAATIDKATILKEQVLYELEMQLVQMEGKLTHLQGERSSEERDKFKVKIHELEEEHKKIQEVNNMLNTQYSNAKKEHARLGNILEEDAVTLRKLTENRQERIYLVEGANKELATLQQKNKQLQVQHNMLKLRVEQIQKALAKEDTSVISLERQKLELETAMKEKKIEITAQKDILLAKKRRLLEEKSEIIKAIEHVNIRISQLQKRYDIIMDSLGSKDSGEEFSISRFKIQMAQEKYELQEKGDELDAKIKKSEKEILAMENTLRVINASNDCYKRNLDSINTNSPEMEEKKDLEMQLGDLFKTLHQRQTDLKEVRNNIQEMEDSLAELNDAEERVKADWRDKDISARQLDKELVEQQRKLHRAEKLLHKLVKEVRKIKEPRIPIHLTEKDIELRGLQELNQSGLQQLAELAARYMETGPVLNRYLAEKNLALPMVRCTGSNTARTKLSCSTLSINQSMYSDDGKSSHLTLSSEPQSQAPSIITLDPSCICSDKSEGTMPKKIPKLKQSHHKKP